MAWFDRARRALTTRANPVSDWLTGSGAAQKHRRLAFESLEPRWVLSHVAPGLVDTPQTYSGALNGKIVFTSGGHGWQWNSSLNRYATYRPEYELVEDFGNVPAPVQHRHSDGIVLNRIRASAVILRRQWFSLQWCRVQ